MLKTSAPESAEPLTFAACCDRFKAAAAQPTSDGRAAISANTVEAIISTVRSTLQFWISEKAGKVSIVASRGSTTPRIEDIDVRPLLPALAGEARRMAEQRNHRVPRNAERLVERFVEVIAGTNFARLTKETRELFLSDGWRQFLALVPDEYEVLKYQQSVIYYISRTAIICARHGVACPSELPERAELERWLIDDGISIGDCSKVVSFVRRLALASLKRDPTFRIPVYSRKFPESARNLAADPTVQSFLTTPIPEDASPSQRRMAILRDIAPLFARFLEQHKRGPAKDLRPATVNARVESFDRCVASLVRLGFGAKLKQMHPKDLFSVERPMSMLSIRPAVSTNDWLDDAELSQLGLLDAEDTLPLIGHVGDECALSAWANSPRSKRAGATADPQYVKAVADDCESVWNMFESVYEPLLSRKNPELLAQCRMGAERALAHLREGPGSVHAAPPVKDKAKLISLVTLPQLVCVGLPALAAYVKDLEQKWKLEKEYALSHSRDHTHAPTLRARKQYLYWLERYVVLGVFCADPMRYKNFAYARVGKGSEIEVRGSIEGGRLQILDVRSRFTPDGGDNPHAALKVHRGRSSGRRRQDRIWHWHPSIIDLDLLSDYFERIWFERVNPRVEGASIAVRDGIDCTDVAKLLAALRNPPADRSALFMGTRASSHPWGGVSQSPISDAFGQALHWICRNVLGSDLPEWELLASLEWFGIFCPQSIRTLWATYWIGIRDQQMIRCPVVPSTQPNGSRLPEVSAIEFAMRATNDDEKTLRREYEVTTGVMLAKLQSADLSDWEHPCAFDSWMNCLPWVQNTFPAELHGPLPLPTHLRRQVESSSPPARTRGKRRSG